MMQTMTTMNMSSLQQRIASSVRPTAVRPAPLRLRSVVVRAEAPKEIQVRPAAGRLIQQLRERHRASCPTSVGQRVVACRRPTII